MPHRNPSRAAALFAAALLSTVLAPLAAPTASATPTAPSNETLLDPSLEGDAEGFALFYAAETARIARTGAQSVNLAPAGATPQPWSVLGAVEAFTTHPVLLSQLTGISYRHNAPTSPPSPISLQLFFGVDLDGDGARDGCLVHAPAPVASTSGWALTTFGTTSSFYVADGDCSVVSATRTLADVQADAAYADATVGSIFLQTLVTGSGVWSPAAPVYVDDLSVGATSGHLVRIEDAADNLCGRASFVRVQDALPCAASGATLMLGPGTVPGGFTVDRPMTLCGTDTMAASCVGSALETIVSGGGANVVTIASDDVTLLNFTIENPAYAGNGAVSPTLLVIGGDRVRALDLELRQAAAPLGLGQTRAATRGILVDAGSEDVLIQNVDVERMPSSRGTNANCAQNACVTVGIDATAAGIERLQIIGNWIDMTGAHPARGMAIGASGPTIEWNAVFTSGGNAAAGTSAGIVATSAGLAGWVVRFNYIEAGGGENHQTAVGLLGVLDAPQLVENTFHLMSRGVLLWPGTRDAYLEGNLFIENGVGLLNHAPRTEVKRNSFQGNGASITLAGDGGLSGTSAGFRVHNSTFLDETSVFRVLGEVPAGTYVDARFNNWGVYTRSEIKGKITSGAADVDERCYVDADQQSHVCPPIASFAWAPDPALWGREIQFIDTSAARGRAIAEHSWDFHDGATTTHRDPAHTFPDPGAHLVTLTVTDVEGYSHSVTTAVDVANTAPVLAPIGPRALAEGETITLALGAVDAEGDPLTFGATGLPSGATFDAANRTFAWTPSFTQEGVHSVRFSATDSRLSDAEDVVFTVAHANALPAIRVEGPTSTSETMTMSFTVRAQDLDGEPAALQMFVLPGGAQFVDHGDSTGTFTWTPTFLQSGRYPISVQAADPVGSSQISFYLDVWNLDRAPVWPSIATKSVGELQNLQFFVSATDPDGDALMYAAVALPPGARFDAAQRRFDWTPTIEQQGLHRATLRASDGNLTKDVVVSIDVQQLNRPPVAGTHADRIVKASRTLSFSINVTDPDADVLDVTIADAPAGLVVTGKNVAWKPTQEQVGAYVLDVLITDAAGATAQAVVRVTVEENLAPTVVLSPPQRADVGQTAVFFANATDPDGAGALAYAWDFNDTDGWKTQRTGASPQWTFGHPGIHNVTLRVSDADGLVTTRNVSIDVDDAIRLVLYMVEDDSNPARSKIGGVYVTDWAARPLASHDVEVWGTYDRALGQPVEVWRTTVRTGANGFAFFAIPNDGALVFAPGKHTMYARTELRDTYQGDTEVAEGRATYGEHVV